MNKISLGLYEHDVDFKCHWTLLTRFVPLTRKFIKHLGANDVPYQHQCGCWTTGNTNNIRLMIIIATS